MSCCCVSKRSKVARVCAEETLAVAATADILNLIVNPLMLWLQGREEGGRRDQYYYYN